ncbi:hypothetical protein ACVWW5_005751 [Bradyrhizobium sp. LM3.4]
MPDEIADNRQHRDAEGEIALRRLEQVGTPDVGDAVGTMRQPDRVDHDQRNDLLERDRHHGEVVPAKPQGRHAQEGAGQQRDHASADEAEPEADMQIRRPDADRIGAEPEERGLRQIDLTAQAEHDRQPEHRDRERGGLEQDVVNVSVEAHVGRERDQDRRTDEIWQVPDQQRLRVNGGRRYRHVVAGGAHAFSATRSPKMPCGRKIRKAIRTRKAKPSL